MRTADDASSSDRADANGDDAVAVDTTSTREEEPQPPAAPWTDERTKEERRLVFVANILLNLCGICLWAGLVIINALYAGIISTTGWDLSQVTLLFTLQIFACFLCCPLWGIAASYFSIRKLLAGAVFVGGLLNIATGLVYLTNSYAGFVVLQLLKGVCLSPCQVLNRCLIPKYYRLAERGKYYGLLEASAAIGGIGGALIAMISYAGGTQGTIEGTGYFGCDGSGTSSNVTCPAPPAPPAPPPDAPAMPPGLEDEGLQCDGGIPKWAVPFFVLGALMLPCSFLIFRYLVDPNKDLAIRKRIGEDRLQIVFPGLLDEDTRLSWPLVKSMFRVKTWLFIVLQGVTGAFPWPALGLLLYWFQYIGINSFLALPVSAVPGIGAGIGGAVGGIIGDCLYRRWSPKYGRTAASHFSITVGPFLFIVFFFAIPHDEDSWWIFALYGLLVGLLISWSAPCNNTILSDVFSEATFPLAYGVAQMAEGSVSAFAPLVVAVIAEEVFGVSDLEVDVSCLTDDQQANNVKGLGDAIFSVCCVGWGLCCIVVFGFYYFYPRESRALNPHLVAPTRKVSSDVDGELSTDAVAPAETAKPQAAGSGAGAEEAI